VVRNFSLPSPQVRIQIPVTVAHGTDITKVKSLLLALADTALGEREDLIAAEPAPTVYLTKMDKATMTFELTLFVHEFASNSIIRDYLNTRIIELFRTEGIIFA
jgi:small-conductance mechanosensitive channel